MKQTTQRTRAVFSRENILMVSACITLCAAIGFAVAGFVVPPVGEIHDSVLWTIAQFLLYTGSALGIATYTYYGFQRMQAQINHRLRMHDERFGGGRLDADPYAEADGVEPETESKSNDNTY